MELLQEIWSVIVGILSSPGCRMSGANHIAPCFYRFGTICCVGIITEFCTLLWMNWLELTCLCIYVFETSSGSFQVVYFTQLFIKTTQVGQKIRITLLQFSE